MYTENERKKYYVDQTVTVTDTETIVYTDIYDVTLCKKSTFSLKII